MAASVYNASVVCVNSLMSHRMRSIFIVMSDRGCGLSNTLSSFPGTRGYVPSQSLFLFPLHEGKSLPGRVRPSVDQVKFGAIRAFETVTTIQCNKRWT